MANHQYSSYQSQIDVTILMNLSDQVNELMNNNPEYRTKQIYVLGTVDEQVDGQLKERLEEATTKFDGERTFLIPYYVGAKHCTGLIIKFKSTNEIARAHLIDPVNNSQFDSEKLNEVFSQIFPTTTIHSRSAQNQVDQSASASSISQNLLTIATSLESIDLKEMDEANQLKQTVNESSDSLSSQCVVVREADCSKSDDASLQTVINEIEIYLLLDDTEIKTAVINDILNDGRHSITKHKDHIVSKIYKEAINGDENRLMVVLKDYVQVKWRTEYELSYPWFGTFIEKYRSAEYYPIYERILIRTANYGNTYMKTFPVLSIILQILFEEITDDVLKDTDVFENIWFSLTNDGLRSIEQYSDYAVKTILHEQLKIPSILFQALREFYHERVVDLLKNNHITNRNNLHELVLNNVAEHGWSTNLEDIEENFTPKSFKNLLEKLHSFHQPLRTSKETKSSIEEKDKRRSVDLSSDVDDQLNKNGEASITNQDQQLVSSQVSNIHIDRMSPHQSETSSSKEVLRKLNQIKEQFAIKSEHIDDIEQQLDELKKLKCTFQYPLVNDAITYLRQEQYHNIDELNDAIDRQENENNQFRREQEVEKEKIESEKQRLETVLNDHRNLFSLEDSARRDHLQEEHLQKCGFTNVAAVRESITKVKGEEEKLHRKIEREQKLRSDRLARLREINAKYHSQKNANNVIPVELATRLESKGLRNLQDLDQKIHELKALIDRHGKDGRLALSIDNFDASSVNQAFVYIVECQCSDEDPIKSFVSEAQQTLQNYLVEHVDYLEQEMNKHYATILQMNDTRTSAKFGNTLGNLLQKLFDLRKFPHVFRYCDGAKRIEIWQNKFHELWIDLNLEIKKSQEKKNIQEWTKRVHIAKALKWIDNVYLDKFPTEGFAIIDRQYSDEMSTQGIENFAAIEDCISKHNYQQVAILFSEQHIFPLDHPNLTKIRNQLQHSLEDFMRDTKNQTKKLEKDDDNDFTLVKQIKENIKKIDSIPKEQTIMKLLDDHLRGILQQFSSGMEEDFNRLFAAKITNVENLLELRRFFEVERCMAHLSKLQLELESICRSKPFAKNIQKLQERLENIESEIDKLDFHNLSRYPEISPNQFLAELKRVREEYPNRYTNIYDNMRGKIHKIVMTAIGESEEGHWQQRADKVRILENAVKYLPIEWQSDFSPQIIKRKDAITNEEQKSRDELNRCLENIKQDETASQLVQLFKRFEEQNMNENMNLLSAAVLNIFEECKKKIQSILNDSIVCSAEKSLKTIIIYKGQLGDYIPQILVLNDEICDLIPRMITKFCGVLARITSIESADSIDVALENILVSTKLRYSSGQVGKQILSSQILHEVIQSMNIVVEFFQKNHEGWTSAMKRRKSVDIRRTMIIARNFDKILKQLKFVCEKYNAEAAKRFARALEKVKSYKDMCSELEELVISINQKLNAQLISEETSLFEDKCNAVFREIGKLLVQMREIHVELREFLPDHCDTTSAEARLQNEIENLGQMLLSHALKKLPTADECDEFRVYYNHLASIALNIMAIGIDIKRSFLDRSETIILEHVESLRKKIKDHTLTIEEIAENLCRIKFFAQNLPMFNKEINRNIDMDLKAFKTQRGALAFEVLATQLKEEDIGCRLIAEHGSFTGETWRKRRAKMQNQDNIEYVMNNLLGHDLTSKVKEVLRKRYQKFRAEYESLIDQYLKLLVSQNRTELSLGNLIRNLKSLLPVPLTNDLSPLQDSSFTEQIPVLLAYIFAVWTLKHTQHYNESRGIEDSRAYLPMPHAAQVIAIFRMLGIGYIENRQLLRIPLPLTKITTGEIVNNLVQIGTGEGKSVVMAVTACVFALLGVDVMCSCYSKYLSTRDQQDFASVFQAFGIEERIDYGTFNELCEKFLNEQCDVRENINKMILENKVSMTQFSRTNSTRPKVLLIDEVDVFLSEKFYGGAYIPAVCVKSPEIKALFDTLWRNRKLSSLRGVAATPAYKICATQFSHWMFLFDEAIKDMLFSLRSFEPSSYIVQSDRIVYVEGESVVDNVLYGYSTIWAYYYEHDQDRISKNSLEANVGIIVNCGTFSYAEMPHDFAFITGVTGTLETLDPSEKEILRKVYHIEKNTFVPSVFGKSNRNYNSTNDVQAVDRTEYYMKILGEINDICDSHRAILVFFESEEKLMTFYNSQELLPIKQCVQIITERISSQERELRVKRAMTHGRVTLLTRTFGRGTDFICENSQLLTHGGVHVLQTFFSQEVSEEYQIMGRGARQGERGSYRMILLYSDLEWVIGADWETKIPQITGSTFYKTLNEMRIEHYRTKCLAKEYSIEQCRRKHKKSKEFMTNLCLNQVNLIQEFLVEENRGANIDSKLSRTILLMDGTGSMAKLLSAAKETVCTMFERASNILRAKNMPEDIFSMQLAVFRNYNSQKEKILEFFPWESKGPNLRNFISTIGPEGGWGNEAIEVGLWHAVKEAETDESVDQVILIGDAPANTKDDVIQKRKKLGEQYWQSTNFANVTYYEDELKKLKEKKISVHTFYLTEAAASNFKRIADETGGRSEFLDIKSPDGAELLTKFVTEEVLRKAARNKGEEAVALYREKYGVSHT